MTDRTPAEILGQALADRQGANYDEAAHEAGHELVKLLEAAYVLVPAGDVDPIEMKYMIPLQIIGDLAATPAVAQAHADMRTQFFGLAAQHGITLLEPPTLTRGLDDFQQQGATFKLTARGRALPNGDHAAEQAHEPTAPPRRPSGLILPGNPHG